MAVKDLFIKVGVRGAKKAEKEVKGVDNALNKLGGAALEVSGAFFAVKGLIAGFSGVVEAAARQEQAEKALQVALGRTSQSLLNQASALQKVTTAGDEAIIEQQAFLASLKFTEDQIKTIIPVALDLSAATGISLESAVRNTSKTFSGLAGELGELVPQLRDLTQEEMKAGEAVRVLGDLFEGQASKQTDTLSGKLEQMSNTIGDTAETLGDVFAPAIIASAELIGNLAKSLQSTIPVIGDFIMNLFGIEKATDPASEQTENFANNQAELARKARKANEALQFQKTLTEKITQNNIKINQSITDQTNALLLEEMQLLGIAGGFDELDIALEKFGVQANAEGEFNKQIIDSLTEMIEVRNRVMSLREQERQIEEESNLAISNSFQTFERNSLRQIEIEKAQEKNRKKFLELYPEEAKLLGLVQNTKFQAAQEDIKNAIIQGQTAENAVKSVLRAEAQEAIAGLVSSIFKSMPFPLNVVLAAGAGAIATTALETGIKQANSIGFAQGGIVPGVNSGAGDTVPAMLTPGEVILNQAQQENLVGGMGGITINFNAPVTNEEFVKDFVIPEIEKTVSGSLA